MAKDKEASAPKQKREKSPAGERTVQIGVNVSKEVNAKLDAISKEQGISKSQLVKNILSKSSLLKQ